MTTRPAPGQRDSSALVLAGAAVLSLFGLTNCGDDSEGDGGGASAGAASGGQGTGGQAGGAGGVTSTGAGTATCGLSGVITSPTVLPDGYPQCEFGTCANPTGTSVDTDIYYEPVVLGQSDNGACCGLATGTGGPGGGLDCDKNTIYIDNQGQCVQLQGTPFAPQCQP